MVLGSVLILLLGAVALAYMYRDTLGLTDPIAELEGGSYYVDLTRAPWSRVREKK